ncbi:hypothetical protein DYH56_11735 [Psychrilyobacter piezotolerans]|uniref:Uncharacterized protein n=1 Tax=Psychrilyobacter piezotolerans TaxID=2293438 RepID=A0ABX9KFU2_9FUSO|nr:hypothetical protein DV867_11735 [Psychrilyobacter sp. S5]REI40236.1 hypothetical protein DYH56_11735 [Psychrilyobacter piezotolerans]
MFSPFNKGGDAQRVEGVLCAEKYLCKSDFKICVIRGKEKVLNLIIHYSFSTIHWAESRQGDIYAKLNKYYK